MKAVKEKEQLQKTFDSEKDSSKNLWRLINSGMTSSSKIGLGYDIQSNNEVLSYEEEINCFVFKCTEEDYGPQEPEPSVSNDRSSEYSTCQSNDSEGSVGTSSEHSVDPESENSSVPQEVYVSKPVTTNEKDFDYHEKKMAREAELNKQRVVNTGNGVARPVWTNADRINHANKFVPRPVQLNAGRPNINSVRPNINSGRTNINSVRPRVNTVNSNVNTVRSKQQVPTKISNNFSHKTSQGDWGSAVKTSAGYNWRTTRQNSNCNGGLPLIRTDHPLKNMVDRGIFDSGCLGHMTGNKDQLEDFEEFNGGSVTFGGSKGYITGKGRIRVEDNPKILAFRKELEEIALKHLGTVSENNSTSTPSVNTGSEPVNTSKFDPDDSAMPELEIFHQSETRIFDEASYDEKGVVTDFNSLPTKIEVSPTPTLRIHNIHPKSQILGDPKSAVQTRSKVQQKSGAHALFSYIQKQQRSNHKDQHHSMQEIVYSLSATVWVLVDLPQGMKEEGIDYDEVFAHVARIEAIRLFLAFASFMGFIVYQMDVKSTFLYGTIDEEVYVSQPLVLLILIILRRFISVKTTITPWKTKMALTRKREWTDVNLKEVTSPSCEEGSSNTFRQPQFGLWFAEIVDFLRGSNLRYALTTNPTIYDSLVKQFWQTATANTLANGTLELHATIDNNVYTITEASIRNKLKLADASRITMLPNNEIFEGMGHMGVYNFSKLIFDGMVANLKSKTKFLMYPRFLQLILDIQTENKHPYLAVTLTKKIFGNMERGFRGALRPLLPDMLLVATTNPSAGQDHPDVAQSQPSSSTIPVPSTSTQPMTVDDLLQLVPQLMTRTDSLEKDLKQTKLIMGSAIVKLVKKVKKLEGILKRRNVVLSDSEEEKPEAQGRKREEQVEDISPTTLEAAKTLSRVASQKLKSIDKGRSIKVSTASGQEEASLTEAIRLDTLEKEKEAKQHYIDEDWDLIRAKIKANAELSKSMLGSGLQREDFAKKMVDLVNQRKKHFAEERARAKLRDSIKGTT
ncbi:putative ribonuclease H-like domain-containing protein [Tanacetum coccineum]|uniref:Ribonuclease H-like domain-containing protein n=1 Tax=Tanacetum coccineum TaxID=301880 RepID=A0ABQ5A8V2_9ASTR